MDGQDPIRCGECNVHFQISPGQVTDGLACPECGGKRFFRDQPSTISPEMPGPDSGSLRDMIGDAASGMTSPTGGNPLQEGTIMGNEGEQPASKRDNFMHSNTSYSATESVMAVPETFNQELYPPLFHDASLTKLAPGGPPLGYMQQYNKEHGMAAPSDPGAIPSLLEMAAPAVAPLLPALIPEAAGAEAVAGGGAAATGGEAAAGAAAGGAATTGETAVEQEAAKESPSLLQRGIAKGLGVGTGEGLIKSIAPLMKGALGLGGPSGSGSAMSQAPGLVQTGSVMEERNSSKDFPMLLVADFETYDSVPSLDEQDDGPHGFDQKEFSVGDKSPTNFENPNNQDSGAMGEDNARSDAPYQTGFAANSPGIERAQAILPTLMQYYHDPEHAGQQDPMVSSLHAMLDQERPGYLDDPHPESDMALQELIDQHRNPSPMGVHAAVGMLPGGAPTTGTMPGQGPMNGIPAPQQANGSCPNCGGVMGPDGSCPQCGMGNTAQPGMATAPPGMNASMPPAMAGIAYHLATHQGPVTPEQIAAVQELLVTWDQSHPGEPNRAQEAPNVPLHPEQYATEMAEIQNQPNIAPQIDPSTQPQPTPAPAMQQAPGSMPVVDPSQPGGGGGQPMQPMSSEHTADANTMTPRCPVCNSGSTSVDMGGSSPGVGPVMARCHSCRNIWSPGGHVARSVLFAGEMDFPNPNMPSQEPHMKWADTQGNDLVEGGVYKITSSAFDLPTEVKILQAKPDGLEVQLVGGIGDQVGQPDFRISRQEAQLEKFTFEPLSMPEANSTDPNTTPGQSAEQVPPLETTDSTPDVSPHTVEGSFEQRCSSCGSSMVDHRMLNPVTTSHDCVCGNHWETNEEGFERASGQDLSWLDEDPTDMSERHIGMEHAVGGQSRNLSDVAARDPRLQAVRQALGPKGQRPDFEHTAGKAFTQSEKRDLINESGSARNLEDLDLDGTHYEARVDYSGKSNEMNVNDDHFGLGL